MNFFLSSLFFDPEGSLDLRSCLHNYAMNGSPIIEKTIDKNELYQHCLTIIVKDTHTKGLEKYECIKTVITIVTVMLIKTKRWRKLTI